jgi:DNA-binding transcriptional ArsR family regulator
MDEGSAMTVELLDKPAQGQQKGLKARVEALLVARQGEALSIGEIVRALDLTKIDHPDVSSVLIKLRNTGRVRSAMGPASSNRGRRFVKRYSFVPPKQERIVVVQEVDLRRQLSFAR